MDSETHPANSASGTSNADASKALQRRGSYRVQITTGSDLNLLVWRITDSASLDRVPSTVHLISEAAKDISETGACILLRNGSPKPIELKPAERVRVQMKYGKLECLFEGRIRLHPGAPRNPDGTSTRAGVHFKSDKNSPAGRQSLATLGKIIAQLRREELRYQRLGLAK